MSKEKTEFLARPLHMLSLRLEPRPSPGIPHRPAKFLFRLPSGLPALAGKAGLSPGQVPSSFQHLLHGPRLRSHPWARGGPGAASGSHHFRFQDKPKHCDTSFQLLQRDYVLLLCVTCSALYSVRHIAVTQQILY